MKHTLFVELSNCEGAVIRALGLVERRGYRLESCRVHAAAGGVRDVELIVTSSRPVELLKRQLERLHDVLRVELQRATVIETREPSIRTATRRI